MPERMNTDRLAKVFAAEFVQSFMDDYPLDEQLFAAAHIGIEVADLLRRAWRDGFNCAKEEKLPEEE